MHGAGESIRRHQTRKINPLALMYAPRHIYFNAARTLK